VIRYLLAFVACVVPLWAQPWDTLRGLKTGESVRVTDTAGQQYRGSFSAVSGDSLTIRTGDGEHSLEMAKVRLVKVRSTSRRIRNLLIGIGIGVATGVAVDQTLGAYMRNETGDSGRPLMYLAPIGLFGGIGGAIPAYRTVYRVR
jgi:hypothetical protein